MNSAVSNAQVVAVYEDAQGELSIDELFEIFEGEIPKGVIKLTLMNGSTLFRSKIKKDDSSVWTSEDEEMTRRLLLQLATNADSDIVKFRAITRIRDEAAGRLDVKGMIKTTNISVTLMQQFAEAEDAIKAAKAKVITVNPEHKHLKQLVSEESEKI